MSHLEDILITTSSSNIHDNYFSAENETPICAPPKNIPLQSGLGCSSLVKAVSSSQTSRLQVYEPNLELGIRSSLFLKVTFHAEDHDHHPWSGQYLQALLYHLSKPCKSKTCQGVPHVRPNTNLIVSMRRSHACARWKTHCHPFTA